MRTTHFSHWPPAVPKTLPPLPASPYSSLKTISAKFPSRTAINYYGAEITYDHLHREVETLARYLIKLGTKSGERVLLCLQNSPQFIIAFYAISAVGAIVVPVNPMSQQAEIAYLIKDTGTALIFAGQEQVEILKQLPDATLKDVIVAAYSDYLDTTQPDKVPQDIIAHTKPIKGLSLHSWRAALQPMGGDELIGPDPDALSIMPYTSGTTGRPKGCIHTNRSTLATAIASSLWLGFDETTVQLVSLPLFHVTGMHICMIGGLHCGGTLHLMARWDRDLAINIIERNRVTTWVAISAMVIDVVNTQGIERRDLSSLAMILGGGAAMPSGVAARLYDLTGLDYIEGYGLSETSAPIMINPLQSPRRACLGIPLMDVDARIIDTDSLSELGPGNIGEIIVSAPQVFQGYWQQPKASAEAFITMDDKPFFRTEDIGYCDEDGFFYMIDRLNRMIITSGYTVWPAAVEAILYQHPAVREACVIAAPDAIRGEIVKALIVRRAGQDDLGEAETISWCRERMSDHNSPRAVVFVEQLPKSGTGKVMWRGLQE